MFKPLHTIDWLTTWIIRLKNLIKSTSCFLSKAELSLFIPLAPIIIMLAVVPVLTLIDSSLVITNQPPTLIDIVRRAHVPDGNIIQIHLNTASTERDYVPIEGVNGAQHAIATPHSIETVSRSYPSLSTRAKFDDDGYVIIRDLNKICQNRSVCINIPDIQEPVQPQQTIRPKTMCKTTFIVIGLTLIGVAVRYFSICC